MNIQSLKLASVEASGYQCWTFYLDGIKHWYSTSPIITIKAQPSIYTFTNLVCNAKTTLFHYNNNERNDNQDAITIGQLNAYLPLPENNLAHIIGRMYKLAILQ